MDNNKNLKLYFYYTANNKSPIREFYCSLNTKIQRKVLAYIGLLIKQNGRLGFPYTNYIKNKIWELRVDFDKNYYRIFYFIFDGEKIILLHGFNKKTNRTPRKEIDKAEKRQQDYLINFNDELYEF